MMIYNCGDVDFLLQNLDEKDLVFSHHSNKRIGQRLINKAFVKNMLFNFDPIEIVPGDFANAFKLFYPSQFNPRKELVVVIAVNEINVVVKSLWEN